MSMKYSWSTPHTLGAISLEERSNAQLLLKQYSPSLLVSPSKFRSLSHSLFEPTNSFEFISGSTRSNYAAGRTILSGTIKKRHNFRKLFSALPSRVSFRSLRGNTGSQDPTRLSKLFSKLKKPKLTAEKSQAQIDDSISRSESSRKSIVSSVLTSTPYLDPLYPGSNTTKVIVRQETKYQIMSTRSICSMRNTSMRRPPATTSSAEEYEIATPAASARNSRLYVQAVNLYNSDYESQEEYQEAGGTPLAVYTRNTDIPESLGQVDLGYARSVEIVYSGFPSSVSPSSSSSLSNDFPSFSFAFTPQVYAQVFALPSGNSSSFGSSINSSSSEQLSHLSEALLDFPSIEQGTQLPFENRSTHSDEHSVDSYYSFCRSPSSSAMLVPARRTQIDPAPHRTGLTRTRARSKVPHPN